MMTRRPSFGKELLGVCWLMLKILIPITAWTAACIWIGRHHLIAAQLVLYGGLLLAMIVYFAYSNYKSQPAGFAKTVGIRQTPFRILGVQSAAPLTTGGTAARMPLDYLQPEPLKLFEVPAGQDAYINFTNVLVDLDGTTWVETEARIHEEAGLANVKVRLAEGGYVLTLFKRTGPQLRFTPKRLTSVMSYAPVIQVLEEDAH